MKRIVFRFSFLLQSLVLVLLAQRVEGQMRIRSAGNQWTDDSHYIYQTLGADNKPVTLQVDMKSGKSTAYIAPKSNRELLNESLPKGNSLGFNDIISPDGKSVVILRDNDLFFFRIGDNEIRRLTNDRIQEVNTRFSPDGSKLAYTKNNDLYVYDIQNNKEIRLTNDASDRIYNGYCAWVYMEEILERSSRYAAFWWSPDGTKLSYLRTDETQVPVFTLNRIDEADGIHGTLEVVPYPKPGDPNPKVKMGIADISTGKTTWVRTDYSTDQYIAWPFWTPDSKKLMVQVLNRDQNDIEFILADPSTGDYKRIYNEKSNTWVEFFEDIYVMKNGTGFLLRSYKSGWENLYYYEWDGKLLAQLTNNEWNINSIDKVDEDLKLVYYTGTGTESTDSHSFRVGLDGKNLLQVTKGPGTHNVSISPKGSYFVDTWSSITSPGSVIVYDKKGKKLMTIQKNDQLAFDPAKNSKADFIRIPTSDGLFNMPAIITYPINFDPSKKYPVVFTIYGGPASKNVNNIWQGNNPSWYAQKA